MVGAGGFVCKGVIMSMLPYGSPDNTVCVENLASIFNDATNSYKFLLLQTILDHVHETGFLKPNLTDQRVLRGMVGRAWWPLFQYRLSFGGQDRMHEAFDRLRLPKEAFTTDPRNSISFD